jgi:pimeloyl-ACP methyl ester carboxylesterase
MKRHTVWGRDHWLAALVEQQAAGLGAPSSESLLWFLSGDETRRRLDEVDIAAELVQFSEVAVVVDEGDQPLPWGRAGSPMDALASLVRAPRALRVFVLSASVRSVIRDEDGTALTRAEIFIDDLVQAIIELRRRSETCLRSRKAIVPIAGDHVLAHVPAAGLAAYLHAAATSAAPGVVHHIECRDGKSTRALIEAVSAAAGILLEPRFGDGANDGRQGDAAWLLPISMLGEQGSVAQPQIHADRRFHDLRSDAFDPLEIARRSLSRHETNSAAMKGDFASMEGLRRLRLPGGDRNYLRYGEGRETLVLINAFGLPMDFWRMLAQSLRRQFHMLALDGSPEPCRPAGVGVIDTYYTTDDSVGRFVADARAMLVAEGVSACHVVSWCGGAKLALALASAAAETVSSIILLAPSFAGIDALGQDSPYERSLATMCDLVLKAPNSAAMMATSMNALVNKAAAAGASAALPELLAAPDSCHLPLLSMPFSSANNIRAFSRQVANFRHHDIMPHLAGSAVRQPAMVVTGSCDTTTSTARAVEACAMLPNSVHAQIADTGHYLVHQNYRLVADLLAAFTQNRLSRGGVHPRAKITIKPRREALVGGEM